MQIFKFPTPEAPLSETAKALFFKNIEGRCSFEQLDLALQIHTNDSLERQTAHEQFMVPPRLTVALILEGDLDAALDGHPLWMNRQDARLDRWLRLGQRIRKIIVSLPMKQVSSLIDASQTNSLAEEQQPFTFAQWQPSAQAIRYAEEILTINRTDTKGGKLAASIAALGLFQQALTQNDDTPMRVTSSQLSTRDVNRARQIRQYVIENIEQSLSVDSLAEHANMSVSTLQRLFKNAYGLTVMEFVRTRRLELARLSLLEEGITVSEAAYQAGYSSVSNFSTAFQREFAYPPSTCIRKTSKPISKTTQ